MVVPSEGFSPAAGTTHDIIIPCLPSMLCVPLWAVLRTTLPAESMLTVTLPLTTWFFYTLSFHLQASLVSLLHLKHICNTSGQIPSQSFHFIKQDLQFRWFPPMWELSLGILEPCGAGQSHLVPLQSLRDSRKWGCWVLSHLPHKILSAMSFVFFFFFVTLCLKARCAQWSWKESSLLSKSLKNCTSHN